MSHLLHFAALAPGVALLVLHILLAMAVAADSAKLESQRSTELVGPIAWTIATAIVGIPVALIYWLIHRSSLHPRAGEPMIRPDHRPKASPR